MPQTNRGHPKTRGTLLCKLALHRSDQNHGRCFGRAAAATVATRQERRIAWDGEAYTKEDFQQHYGVNNFAEIWSTAVSEHREDIGWTPDKNPRLYTAAERGEISF